MRREQMPWRRPGTIWPRSPMSRLTTVPSCGWGSSSRSSASCSAWTTVASAARAPPPRRPRHPRGSSHRRRLPRRPRRSTGCSGPGAAVPVPGVGVGVGVGAAAFGCEEKPLTPTRGAFCCWGCCRPTAPAGPAGRRGAPPNLLRRRLPPSCGPPARPVRPARRLRAPAPAARRRSPAVCRTRGPAGLPAGSAAGCWAGAAVVVGLSRASRASRSCWRAESRWARAASRFASAYSGSRVFDDLTGGHRVPDGHADVLDAAAGGEVQRGAPGTRDGAGGGDGLGDRAASHRGGAQAGVVGAARGQGHDGAAAASSTTSTISPLTIHRERRPPAMWRTLSRRHPAPTPGSALGE